MRDNFITTSNRGLQENTLPFRLYQKAKKFGVWDPKDIDFSQDIIDWNILPDDQKKSIIRLISQFQGGEEAVTLDLLPLIMIIAKEGRIEEEMFLTTFLFEEAKHTEFFRIFLNEIGENKDLSHYHSDTYKEIFCTILPDAMNTLLSDDSKEAITRASTIYNMFVEGVLAETGYYSLYNNLEQAGVMPGLMKGIGYLKRDEARHIGYGTYLLQRLISEHPPLYDQVCNIMNDLAPLAQSLTEEGMEGNSINAFGNSLEATMTFAMKQLSIRLDILKRAIDKDITEIEKTTEEEVGVL